jgi:hypothetical protein
MRRPIRIHSRGTDREPWARAEARAKFVIENILSAFDLERSRIRSSLGYTKPMQSTTNLNVTIDNMSREAGFFPLLGGLLFTVENRLREKSINSLFWRMAYPFIRILIGPLRYILSAKG